MNTTPSIIATLVPEEERLATIEKTFGMLFPMRIELFIYTIAGHLSEEYKGGYWHYYQLSNGGFYMYPESRYPFHTVCDNGWFLPESCG